MPMISAKCRPGLRVWNEDKENHHGRDQIKILSLEINFLNPPIHLSYIIFCKHNVYKHTEPDF